MSSSRAFSIRCLLAALKFPVLSVFLSILVLGASASSVFAGDTVQQQHVQVQFIAALGHPDANSGTGAEDWGLWRSDPGRTGVWLSLFPILQAAGGYAPGNWRFDPSDWWVDENGLLMTKPDFPLPAGKYLVTGEREVTTTLTVHARDAAGEQRWELDEDANLFDVTHLACRSARYTPAVAGESCSPSSVDRSVFRIAPDDPMPDVPGCSKQDYQVLIVLDVLAES